MLEYMDEDWYNCLNTGEYSNEDVFWKCKDYCNKKRIIGKGKIPPKMFCDIFNEYYEKHTLCQIYNEDYIEMLIFHPKKDYRYRKSKSNVYLLFNTHFDKKVKSMELNKSSFNYQKLIDNIIFQN